MNAEEVIVLPWVHEVFVDQCPRRDDTRNSSGVLKLAFRPVRRCVNKFVTDGDMFIQVLNKDFEVTVQLIRRKASLFTSAHA